VGEDDTRMTQENLPDRRQINKHRWGTWTTRTNTYWKKKLKWR